MAKRPIAPIVNGPIRLRLLEERDLAMTLAWRNQDHIRKWFLTSAEISEPQHRSWWDQYAQRDDDFVFVIEECEALKRPIGQLSIYRIDRENKRAEFGRMLIGDAAAGGRGLAKLATTAVVDWALSEGGLDELYLEVLPENAPARAVYERCGFGIDSTDAGIIRMSRRAGAAS